MTFTEDFNGLITALVVFTFLSFAVIFIGFSIRAMIADGVDYD